LFFYNIIKNNFYHKWNLIAGKKAVILGAAIMLSGAKPGRDENRHHQKL
jgi:hypothetical protein